MFQLLMILIILAIIVFILCIIGSFFTLIFSGITQAALWLWEKFKKMSLASKIYTVIAIPAAIAALPALIVWVSTGDLENVATVEMMIAAPLISIFIMAGVIWLIYLALRAVIALMKDFNGVKKRMADYSKKREELFFKKDEP